MTNIFEKIATSVPATRTAALVANGRGERWDPKLNPSVIQFDAPPKTLPAPEPGPDLSGQTVGRLVVVGYLGSDNQGRGRWLVRCVCGSYESRRAKAISNPANDEDRCQRCYRLHLLKKRDVFHRTGKWPDGERL